MLEPAPCTTRPFTALLSTVPLQVIAVGLFVLTASAGCSGPAEKDDKPVTNEQAETPQAPESRDEEEAPKPSVTLETVEPSSFRECRRIEDPTVGRIYVCEKSGFAAVFSTPNEWSEGEKMAGLGDYAEGVIRSVYGFGGEFRFEVDTVALGGEGRKVLHFDATQVEALDTAGAEFSLADDPEGYRVVGCVALPKIGFQSCEKVLSYFYGEQGADAIDVYLDEQPVRLAGREISLPDQCEKLDTRTIRCPASELVTAPVMEPNLIAAEAALRSEQLSQFETNCREGYEAWDAVCSVDGVPTNCYVAACNDQGHIQVAAMASIRDETVVLSCRFNNKQTKTLPSLCRQVLEPGDIVEPPDESGTP